MVFQIQVSSCLFSHRSHAVFSKPSLSCSWIVIITIIIKAKISEIIIKERSAFSHICKYYFVSFSKIKNKNSKMQRPHCRNAIAHSLLCGIT